MTKKQTTTRKKKIPQVVMLSMWRNDEKRQLHKRAEHLLHKSHSKLRWIWSVGDCDLEDKTLEMLEEVANSHPNKDISIIYRDTGGKDRYERLSRSFSDALDHVKRTDDLVMVHESDILSSQDVIERLLSSGKMPVAGWPVLHIHGRELFYDIWAYRSDGKMFKNDPPYSDVYNPDEVFEVDSVGTVWLIHAIDIWKHGVRCEHWCTLEVCEKLRALGRQFWVDPTVTVEQPADLWIPQRVIG